jgi:hypothetical protein
MSDLIIIPIDESGAQEFVRKHHPHQAPVMYPKFCIGIAKRQHDISGGSLMELCGVVIAGPSESLMMDDSRTLEANVTTDGTPDADSRLYRACQRAAFALGYRKVVAVLNPTGSVLVLKRAGWHRIAIADVELPE